MQGKIRNYSKKKETAKINKFAINISGRDKKFEDGSKDKI